MAITTRSMTDRVHAVKISGTLTEVDPLSRQFLVDFKVVSLRFLVTG